jgi:hypothetical protein
MAYAALGISRLNGSKIAELEARLKTIELKTDELLAGYEEEKSRARGRSISAGKWRAKASRLQAELDRLASQISESRARTSSVVTLA